MNEINHYKSLPKVEVSFQDDFSGTEREITLTPRYILSSLSKIGKEVNIGDKLLLWEKDEESNDNYFLCNIAEVVEGDENSIKDYIGKDISLNEMARIENKLVIIKINSDAYFNLPIDSGVFKE